VGIHHLDMAKGYKERAERRFGKQIAFAFEDSAA
jgi:hypothetical protein